MLKAIPFKKNNDEPPPPPHVSTKEDIEAVETIKALLRSGAKVIEGNKFVNDEGKGYYGLLLQTDKKSFASIVTMVPVPMLFVQNEVMRFTET